MTTVETVLFDLDNTLVQYRRSPGEILSVAFDSVGVEPIFPVESYYDRFDEFAEQTDSIDELRSACFAALAAERGYERQLGREVAAAFSKERDQTSVEFLPQAESVLDSFYEQYTLGIVTNGSPDSQRQKIAAAGLREWIDAVVFAGYETPVKPAPEPFERALSLLSGTPETTVHIGDSLESDIHGAANAGIDSVWLSPEKEKSQATYTIESLGELSPPPWDN